MRIELEVEGGELNEIEANGVSSLTDAVMLQKLISLLEGRAEERAQEVERGEDEDDEDEDDEADEPQPEPEQAAEATLRSLIGNTQKAIAVPFAVDPNALPETAVFYDKDGREVGRIENLASQPQIEVTAQA